MRRWMIFPFIVLFFSLTVSRCHAWQAGYSYKQNTLTSVWAQATPSLCSTCTQGQAWLFQYKSQYVYVIVDAYGRIYTMSSLAPMALFVAQTKPGSAVDVSFSANYRTAGKVTAAVTYKATTGRQQRTLKKFMLPGWHINGGNPTVFSYGPESTIPAGVVDQWQSTLPIGSTPLVSGASACGNPSWFNVKKTCP